mmetsp:Transcript_17279/g.41513  ORF Transcript_17279/g.41513 Transcript_17279/m.41513 type:complete len:166 (-) Transcript_17279:441-938(-)
MPSTTPHPALSPTCAHRNAINNPNVQSVQIGSLPPPQCVVEQQQRREPINEGLHEPQQACRPAHRGLARPRHGVEAFCDVNDDGNREDGLKVPSVWQQQHRHLREPRKSHVDTASGEEEPQRVHEGKLLHREADLTASEADSQWFQTITSRARSREAVAAKGASF